VLLFSIFISLGADQNQKVGAEGVFGKIYNITYAKNGYACGYFAPTFFFSTTNEAVGDGFFFDIDALLISRWWVAHFDGGHSEGYSLLFGALVFGTHTSKSGVSESMVGVLDPQGRCYPD